MMKIKYLCLILISLVLITGCVNKSKDKITGDAVKETEEKSVCNPPYYEYKKGDCCLDKDDNKICDNDELKEETSKEDIESSDEDIEKVALKFANTWEKGYYGGLYDFFTPELKSQKEKSEFVRILNHSRIIEEVPVIRLDDIKNLDEDTALAYFHVAGFIGFKEKEEIPAFEMKLVDNEWKFNGFGAFFMAECVYDYDCPYTEECKFKCESEDVTKFGYSECNNLKCGCSCKNVLALKPLCTTVFSNYESQENKRIMCDRVDKSQHGINIKFNMDKEGAILTFKNREDKRLTNVKIIINDNYRLDKGIMEVGEEFTINKTSFVNNDGRNMKQTTDVNFIYLYSSQGKWIYEIKWNYLDKIAFYFDLIEKK